ncbi:hypothetical protein LEP1GSC016_2690 [Leptospira borgpetersenii serovar Hardjo-bovis str. Sponselee]|uniref:Uncharacterized protein n=1 Tax=Leptospira borgpetersenii serovar Hardjo-bovis str. Sponselee TaxID=1303729 RepID=M6BU46_LEPBO|nr:hypothetical protein B9T54_01065 [Leptospira borgpetersenii serovar Hardjo-bovis]AYR07354.1 hypothetical protein D1609_01070 [Leptospira borgpetersenii serovar Hardjo-bovis]EMJ82041.1 hypothetical protein LEP1GSC016_2690 [Leptospira borgpetersenii serovar Hardjo-bovis str. Sponselee]TQE54142.1 hypothetical protein FFZ95_04885 [Leptospira borgpetersenii]TQE57633.1 hypothetical protein FFZ96_06165 [Leptospira borgpetersenii]
MRHSENTENRSRSVDNRILRVSIMRISFFTVMNFYTDQNPFLRLTEKIRYGSFVFCPFGFDIRN